jgi:hypothetical protein
MSSDTRRPAGDPDGVRIVRSEDGRRGMGRRMTVAAVAVVVLGVTAIWSMRAAPPRHGAHEGTPAPTEEIRRTAPRPELRPVATDVAPVPRAPVPRQESRRSAAAEERRRQHFEQLARDMIDALRASGETEGLAAFPPPGTSPPIAGLVVPEDFELPEGYVRHYQTTDQGERLEAILMFSPDFDFVDADGRPVETPADRVVPPELAPPGLPIRTLEVPEDPRTRRR